MEKRISLWKIAIFILLAGLFDGLFAYVVVEMFHIPLFLDTIGLLTITFTFGGIPGLLTALASQFFLEWIGGYLNIWIYIYVFCSFAAVGVVCIFKNSIEKARSKLTVVIILFICSLVMCFAVSLTGGIINVIGDIFEDTHGGNIQTDYFKISLFKMSFSSFAANVLSRVPVNIIDRPISTYAAFGCSILIKRLLNRKQN